MNTLYYGDNLDILKRYIEDESVDLVYLDPPFNSNQNYNVLFQERDGARAASQIRAFADTWTWDQEGESVFAEMVTAGGKVSDCLQAFRTFLSPCDMLAYLVMMAPRLVELRRVMKPTASIYLHCDPSASHYLKILLDAVFGPQRFLNEINWKRKYGRTGPIKRFGTACDVIFFYCKSEKYLFNTVYTENDPEYIEHFFRHKDPDGRLFRIDNLASPNPRPNLTYEYKGYKPPAKGWAISREKMELWDKEGRLYFPKSIDGRIQRKRYLDELKGEEVQSLWDDILPIGSQAAERLGYPTQKPEALLERIINASSNEGDVVLDPFCGCGTTIAAAQKLKRKWIGIDITHLAITLMKHRLSDAYGSGAVFKVIGEPTSLPDAQALADSDKYQFQWWALGLAGARPLEEKKGADKGIDGKIIFEGNEKGKYESVIISVKGGHLKATDVRDLRGVLDREKAAIGVLISMQEPSKLMKTEAVTTGFYESSIYGSKHPKMQLITIEELLAGKKIDMPPLLSPGSTFKKAPRAKKPTGEQIKMFDEES